MAEHVWTVLCQHAVIDKYSNNASLLYVVEQIKLSIDKNTILSEIKERGADGVGLQMEMMSLWTRTDPDAPEPIYKSYVRLVTPAGKRIEMAEANIDLSEHQSFRVKMTVPGIPFDGFGVYWFEVDFKGQGDRETKARVPLNVRAPEDAPSGHGVTRLYRKRPGSSTWHFCLNCSNWPVADYEASNHDPAVGEFCNECRAKERVGRCQQRMA